MRLAHFRGLGGFSLDPGVASSSLLAAICLKALGTLTLVTPQRTCSKETELASGCMDVDVKGSIMSSGGAS